MLLKKTFSTLVILASIQAARADDTKVVDASQLGNTSLSVSSGQSLAIDFGTASTLSLSGDLRNQGTIYLFSSNPNTNSATIQTNSIYNASGAVLTSILPASGIPGVSFAVPLSFSLIARDSIVNQGTISSAGALSMAANTISNVSTGSVAAMISSVANLNLTAANIINSGTMASYQADINLSALNSNLFHALNINGTDGLFSARGAINIVGTAGYGSLNITGGDFIAKQLNIDACGGLVEALLHSASGPINVTAGALKLSTQEGQLTLGRLDLSGDPVVYNQFGDVELTDSIFTKGGPLTIIASRDVLTKDGGKPIVISTLLEDPGPEGSFDPANALVADDGSSSLVIVAGADFNIDSSNNQISSVKPSGSGGDITLDQNVVRISGDQLTLIALGGKGLERIGNISLGQAPLVAGKVKAKDGSNPINILATGNVQLGPVLDSTDAPPDKSTGLVNIVLGAPTQLDNLKFGDDGVLLSNLSYDTSLITATGMVHTLSFDSAGTASVAALDPIRVSSTGQVSNLNIDSNSNITILDRSNVSNLSVNLSANNSLNLIGSVGSVSATFNGLNSITGAMPSSAAIVLTGNINRNLSFANISSLSVNNAGAGKTTLNLSGTINSINTNVTSNGSMDVKVQGKFSTLNATRSNTGVQTLNLTSSTGNTINISGSKATDLTVSNNTTVTTVNMNAANGPFTYTQDSTSKVTNLNVRSSGSPLTGGSVTIDAAKLVNASIFTNNQDIVFKQGIANSTSITAKASGTGGVSIGGSGITASSNLTLQGKNFTLFGAATSAALSAPTVSLTVNGQTGKATLPATITPNASQNLTLTLIGPVDLGVSRTISAPSVNLNLDGSTSSFSLNAAGGATPSLKVFGTSNLTVDLKGTINLPGNFKTFDAVAGADVRFSSPDLKVVSSGKLSVNGNLSLITEYGGINFGVYPNYSIVGNTRTIVPGRLQLGAGSVLDLRKTGDQTIPILFDLRLNELSLGNDTLIRSGSPLNFTMSSSLTVAPASGALPPGWVNTPVTIELPANGIAGIKSAGGNFFINSTISDPFGTFSRAPVFQIPAQAAPNQSLTVTLNSKVATDRGTLQLRGGPTIFTGAGNVLVDDRVIIQSDSDISFHSNVGNVDIRGSVQPFSLRANPACTNCQGRATETFVLQTTVTTISSSVIASDVTKRTLSLGSGDEQAQSSTINTQFMGLSLSDDDLVLGSQDTEVSQSGTRRITLGKGKILAQSGAEELTVQTSQGEVKLAPNSVVAIQSDGKNNVRVSSLGGDGVIGATISSTRSASSQSVQLATGEELLLTSDMADEEYVPADGLLDREVVSGRIQFDDDTHAVKSHVDVQKLVKYEFVLGGRTISGEIRNKNSYQKLEARLNLNRPGSPAGEVVHRLANVPTLRVTRIGAEIGGQNAVLVFDHSANVHTEFGDFSSPKGSILYASYDKDGNLHLMNIHGSAQMKTLRSRAVDSRIPGQELIFSHSATPRFSDHVGRRNVKHLVEGNGLSVHCAEFSIFSLISTNKDLRQALMTDKKLTDTALKNYVAIQIGLKHGPYSSESP